MGKAKRLSSCTGLLLCGSNPKVFEGCEVAVENSDLEKIDSDGGNCTFQLGEKPRQRAPLELQAPVGVQKGAKRHGGVWITRDEPRGVVAKFRDKLQSPKPSTLVQRRGKDGVAVLQLDDIQKRQLCDLSSQPSSPASQAPSTPLSGTPTSFGSPRTPGADSDSASPVSVLPSANPFSKRYEKQFLGPKQSTCRRIDSVLAMQRQEKASSSPLRRSLRSPSRAWQSVKRSVSPSHHHAPERPLAPPKKLPPAALAALHGVRPLSVKSGELTGYWSENGTSSSPAVRSAPLDFSASERTVAEWEALMTDMTACQDSEDDTMSSVESQGSGSASSTVVAGFVGVLPVVEEEAPAFQGADESATAEAHAEEDQSLPSTGRNSSEGSMVEDKYEYRRPPLEVHLAEERQTVAAEKRRSARRVVASKVVQELSKSSKVQCSRAAASPPRNGGWDSESEEDFQTAAGAYLGPRLRSRAPPSARSAYFAAAAPSTGVPRLQDADLHERVAALRRATLRMSQAHSRLEESFQIAEQVMRKLRPDLCTESPGYGSDSAVHRTNSSLLLRYMRPDMAREPALQRGRSGY